MAERLKMSVAERLSRYLEVASQAAKEGSQRISSYQIALYTGVNPTQVRRDLSAFGRFGTRGLGYEIEVLRERIRDILGARPGRSIVVVGAGRIGEALVCSQLFAAHGIEIAAIFDTDPDKIGRRQGALTVLPASELGEQVRRHSAVAGLIAVPAEAAQEVADELVRAGLKVVFNYSEALLDVPGDVVVQTLSPVAGLLSSLRLQTG